MRHIKFKIIAVILFCIIQTGLQAQETIPVTGGNANGNGGLADYTIGQVFYTTSTGTTGLVVQGVQQPYEISVISGVGDATGINLTCSVYPNPTADYLTLKIDGDVSPQSIVSLYDISGKLLVNIEITNNETTISMENLVPAVYFLYVTDDTKVVKTFKIIKN